MNQATVGTYFKKRGVQDPPHPWAAALQEARGLPV